MTDNQTDGTAIENGAAPVRPSLLEQITVVLYREDPDVHPHSMVNYIKATQQARAVLDALNIEESTDTLYSVATEFDQDGTPISFTYSGTLEQCRNWLPRIEQHRPGAKVVTRTRTARYLPTQFGPYEVID